MKNLLLSFLGLTLILGCGGDDGPPPVPEGAILVFPLQNSECTTGQSINETLSQVTFEWQSAAHTDLYTLSAVNLNTNVPQNITTQSTSASLSIEKGAPYSWSVTSTNENSSQTAISESWLFYNAGSQTTYAPFPAQIVSPKSGVTVQMNAMGEISLEWIGADVEGDIQSFEVYFSEQNPPQDLLITTDSGTLQAAATVVSGVIYYWRVVTIDAEGNASDSGTYDFRVL